MDFVKGIFKVLTKQPGVDGTPIEWSKVVLLWLLCVVFFLYSVGSDFLPSMFQLPDSYRYAVMAACMYGIIWMVRQYGDLS